MLSSLSPRQILMFFIGVSIYIYIKLMFLLGSCCDAGTVLRNTMDDSAVLAGSSDLIVVKHKSGEYRSSPLIICFGPQALIRQYSKLSLVANGRAIQECSFIVDQKGYVQPQLLSQKDVRLMNLKYGANKCIFILEDVELAFEAHLFSDNDKILVSDVDGTLTKSDIGGHFSNMLGKNYLHDSYADLIKKAAENGYQIVWLTMRSISLYEYSKTYIRDFVGVDGVLLMEPEEFLPAVINEVTKKTGNIKANMMKQIRKLFNLNPFIGGLGNRENDAIAYLHAGIPKESIFIIDTASRVQHMSSDKPGLTYFKMTQDHQNYIPRYSAHRVGY